MLSEKEIIKKQEQRISEMEQYIFALHEENKLQRELIEMLQKENSLIQKHYEDYVNAVHKMMNDLDSK